MMDAPIFVFADDLGVFASVREAESHYEPWIEEMVKAVYDQHGNVFQFIGSGARGVEIKLVQPPMNRRIDFIQRLRDHLIRLAQIRPDIIDETWVKQASEDTLVKWSIEFHSEPTKVASNVGSG